MGKGYEAESYIEEALAESQELGDQAGQMYALEVKARIAAEEGEIDKARSLFYNSYQLATTVKDRKQIASIFSHFGEMMFEQNEAFTAARAWAYALNEYTLCGVEDHQLQLKLATLLDSFSSDERSQLEERRNREKPEQLLNPLIRQFLPR